jgi:hypothetical protein
MKMNIIKKTVMACSVAGLMAVGCVSFAQAKSMRMTNGYDQYGDPAPVGLSDLGPVSTQAIIIPVSADKKTNSLPVSTIKCGIFTGWPKADFEGHQTKLAKCDKASCAAEDVPVATCEWKGMTAAQQGLYGYTLTSSQMPTNAITPNGSLTGWGQFVACGVPDGNTPASYSSANTTMTIDATNITCTYSK